MRGSGAEPRRTFVALFPPADVIEALTALRTRLEPDLPGLRWTSPANLHLTLRFFGPLHADARETAYRVMDTLASTVTPFRLALAGVGTFPRWAAPRVLWAGTERGGRTLEAVARTLDRGFGDAGLGAADKPFRAHLTLGRWKDAQALDPRRAQEAADGVGAVGDFVVSGLDLVTSRLDPGGAVYTRVGGVRFLKPEPG